MELDPQCPADVKASKSEQENENDKSKTDETTLPKLSPQEFRQWNHMADEMNLYVRNISRQALKKDTDVWDSTIISAQPGINCTTPPAPASDPKA